MINKKKSRGAEMANTGIIRSKSGVRGRDRRGIRAKDFLQQTTDPMAKINGRSPEYDRPRVMLETMRIEGHDTMTAKDWAFYEYLVSTAREGGIERDWHVMDLRTVTAFLGDEHKSGRVRASLKRITQTMVTYDFRSEQFRTYGSMPLVLADIRQDLRAGTACVRYSIPEPVREAILDATTYTWLQINLFPLFRSRYTGRLYQRLAYLSGLPDKASRRWEVSPAELAAILSYPLEADGTLRVASLTRRAIEPAMADLQNEDVQDLMAFKVKMLDPVRAEGRGAGRGRRIEAFVFEVTARKQYIESVQAARLSKPAMNVVRMHDDRLGPEELPHTTLVGRAVTKTGIDAVALSHGWRAAIKNAKADPDADVLPGLQGGTLLSIMQTNGVGGAFLMWAEMAAEVETIPAEAPARPAPRPAPAFIADEGDGGVMPAMEIAPEPTLEPQPEPAAPKAKRTPEERSARLLELAAEGAQRLLDVIDGWEPGLGRQFRCHNVEGVLPRWCDPQTDPWVYLEEVPGHGTVFAALKLLGKADHETRKQSLSRIAWAIKDRDWDRLRRVGGAVIAASKKGELARGTLPKPHRAEGFLPTTVVSELSAEYGCADPIYSAGDTSNDRDLPEAEGDDCPG